MTGRPQALLGLSAQDVRFYGQSLSGNTKAVERIRANQFQQRSEAFEQQRNAALRAMAEQNSTATSPIVSSADETAELFTKAGCWWRHAVQGYEGIEAELQADFDEWVKDIAI